LRGGSQPLTSAVYTLTARIRVLFYPTNNSGGGVGVSDGTKHIVFKFVFNSGGCFAEVVKYTNATTFSANYYAVAWNIAANQDMWVQIKNDGTHRSFTYSSDGANFMPPSIGSSSTFPVFTAFNDFIATETVATFVLAPQNSTGAANTLESWNITYP
jgi:hypothetical protein